MLNALLLIGAAWAGEWTNLGVTNNVAVFRKQEEGTGLYAFKGEATSDLPVGQLMGILRNEDISKEWVDMMMFATVVETYSENHMLLHQGYDLPWPVSDRDYVFDKKVVYDANKKTATVHLSSVESAKVPVTSEFVRARGERTFWQFSVMEDGRTKIVVEVLTDPEGALPDWAVNSIQADWPHKSITSLIARASKGDVPHDKNTEGWQ
jgi:hypothetical protein